MSEKDTLIVMAAAYDDLADAEADYEAVKALYYEVETSHDFDAAVLERDDYIEAATVCASFLLSERRNADGRLLRTPRIGAFLDDYA